jgi:mono/diheme cytochrome c family protein
VASLADFQVIHAKIGCGISNGAIGMNLDNPGRIIGLVVFLLLFASEFSIASPLQDASKTTDDNTTKKISMLFKAHCNRCHGEKKPGGMVRLDNLPFELNTNADVWFSIREQIDQELMPPDNQQRFPRPMPD